jgi:hypothetical protein
MSSKSSFSQSNIPSSINILRIYSLYIYAVVELYTFTSFTYGWLYPQISIASIIIRIFILSHVIILYNRQPGKKVNTYILQFSQQHRDLV